MSSIVWRWEERDFGFRFRVGQGRRISEHYQAKAAGEFYIVPPSQRKLSTARVEELSTILEKPSAARDVANPWRNYDRDWDWIESDDHICLNYAGCLEKGEVDRREDEGVQRAMDLVTNLVERPDPVQLTNKLICQLHVQLMGAIYPFAGRWRTVALHKGDGPTRWPLPLGGIQPLMDILERETLLRSPVISENDEDVFKYASEVMNEVLAIHPFREGNGRTAFIIGNLLLMQNNMLPLTSYERRSEEEKYFAACEAGRIKKNYGPLALLLEEWEDLAIDRWSDSNE